MTGTADRIAELLTELVDERLADADRNVSVSADDITGLDDAVNGIIDDRDQNIDVDDVRGLNDAIADAVRDEVRDNLRDHLDEVDWSEKLSDTISDNVDEALSHKEVVTKEQVSGLVLEALRGPEVQALIQGEVRKALVNLISGLVTGLLPAVPLAQPVNGQ
jgi:hypothetical protein